LSLLEDDKKGYWGQPEAPSINKEAIPDHQDGFSLPQGIFAGNHPGAA